MLPFCQQQVGGIHKKCFEGRNAMSTLFIGRGDFHLGTVRTDAEGNVVR